MSTSDTTDELLIYEDIDLDHLIDKDEEATERKHINYICELSYEIQNFCRNNSIFLFNKPNVTNIMLDSLL